MSGMLMQGGLVEAREALTGLAELPLYGLTDAERLAAQQEAVTVLRLAEAALVALVPAGPVRVAKDTLVGQLRLSHRHANELVETAKALRDSQFTPTAEALATGAIGAEHAKRVTQAHQEAARRRGHRRGEGAGPAGPAGPRGPGRP